MNPSPPNTLDAPGIEQYAFAGDDAQTVCDLKTIACLVNTGISVNEEPDKMLEELTPTNSDTIPFDFILKQLADEALATDQQTNSCETSPHLVTACSDDNGTSSSYNNVISRDNRPRGNSDVTDQSDTVTNYGKIRLDSAISMDSEDMCGDPEHILNRASNITTDSGIWGSDVQSDTHLPEDLTSFPPKGNKPDNDNEVLDDIEMKFCA